MNRTRRNAVVTARLILIAILSLIRWAVFEPLYYVFLIIYTIAETVIEWIKSFVSWAVTANEHLLNDTTTADK